MASELLAAPPRKRPSILPTTTTVSAAADGTTTTTTTITVSTAANGTTTTTTTTASSPTATATSTDPTISSLSQDDLCEIFLRLPDLPALVRAALTCRSWLGSVRSSPAVRRLFRALHPAPLIGLFLNINGDSNPLFIPIRLSDSDSVVTAALRRGDFFLTSLPKSLWGWSVTDCRDGCILLWNKHVYNDLSLATLNPMTWKVDILPLPAGIAAGSRRHPCFIGFHLQFSDEKPWLFRVICVCTNRRKVRTAIFSSETWDWVIQPWVYIGGNYSLKFKAGSLVNGSIYWPCHGEGRMIRINTDTLDTTFVDLPGKVKVINGYNFKVGDTKDGELCIVYQSGLFLHVWIRSMDSNGTEIWVPQNRISFRAQIDRISQELNGFIKIVQVRSGYVYLSMKYMAPVALIRSFFSLSLDTLMLELLLEDELRDDFYPYIMAWPPSLVADDASIGTEGSH